MHHTTIRHTLAALALGLGLALAGAPALAGETEPDMLWADTGGGTGGEAGFRIATTTDGGTVTFCYLELPATFGSITLSATGATYGSALVKHDADGTVEWARAIHHSSDPLAIGATSDGGVIVVPALFEDTTFAPESSTPVEVEMSGGGMAIAKYDADGDLLWVHGTALGSGSFVGQGLGIGIFADDSFVVAGTFAGEVTFGPSGGTTETVTSSQSTGGADLTTGFVARYESDGDCDWVVRLPTDTRSQAFGIAALSDGSCLVGGDFRGEVTFDEDATTPITLEGAGTDLFFARYLSDGSFDWVRHAGGTGSEAVEDAAVGADDSVVFTGRIQGDVTFSVDETDETTASGRFFAARYQKNGTLEWVAEATGFGRGWNVAPFADGSWVVTGDFSGTLTFGDGETNETDLVASGGDAFIARFLDDGTLAWAERIGGNAVDIGYGVATATDGTFVVTGEFKGTTKIGVGEDNEATPTSAGDWDAFFAKYRAFPANAAPTGTDGEADTLEATLPDDSTRTVEVDFTTVTGGGVTSVTTSASSETGTPSGYKLGEEAIWYDVATTATFSGTIDLCFSWDEGDFANEDNIALFHYEDDAWVDVTTSLDKTNNVVCGQTSSLSPFVLVEIEYDFGGIEQPVNADGSSIFKAGRVIPLKFGLTGPDGAAVADAEATLRVFKVSDDVLGTDEEVDAESAGKANEGNAFRYDTGSKLYVFNLGTKGLDTGSYRIDLTLDDGSTHSVNLSLE